MQTDALPPILPPGLTPRPRPGDHVLFARGAELGVVQEIGPGRFQVAAGDLLLWLRAESVVSRSAGLVRLACEPGELYRFAVSRGGPAGRQFQAGRPRAGVA